MIYLTKDMNTDSMENLTADQRLRYGGISQNIP